MRRGLLLCLACPVLLSACVGRVVTTPIDPADLVTQGKELNGIVGYRAVQVVEVDRLTQFSADGKSFTTNCSPAELRKLVSVPDLQHPLLISYHHGVLEGYSFGVTLNADGVITGINSVSAPDQGKTLANAATVATDVAKLRAFGDFAQAGGPVQPCNTSPSFETYVPPPKVEF